VTIWAQHCHRGVTVERDKGLTEDALGRCDGAMSARIVLWARARAAARIAWCALVAAVTLFIVGCAAPAPTPPGRTPHFLWEYEALDYVRGTPLYLAWAR